MTLLWFPCLFTEKKDFHIKAVYSFLNSLLKRYSMQRFCFEKIQQQVCCGVLVHNLCMLMKISVDDVFQSILFYLCAMSFDAGDYVCPSPPFL